MPTAAGQSAGAGVCPACGSTFDGNGGRGRCVRCDIGTSQPVKPVANVAPGEPSRHPLREIMVVAAPSVATTTSYTLMQFVDGLMVSHITPPDPVYLAAQGNGGLATWIPMSVVAGLLGVVNTYVAQHLGVGEPRRGAAYAWNGLWLAAVAALLMLAYALGLPLVFSLADHEPRLIELETQYARVLIAGGFFSMATRGLAQYFYGMHRPSVVFVAAVVGNGVNVAANYALIFGNWGAPALGVTGSAISTVIGSIVEFAIPMSLFLSRDWNERYGTRSPWRPSMAHMRDIWKIGWPGGLMFGNEMICWGYFTLYLVGHFGSLHSTASWIALRYMHLSFMPAVGISFAMTAIVGRYLGMRRPDLAWSHARLGVLITMAYMGLCAVAFVLFRRPMAELFSDEPAVVDLASRVILLAAVFQLFDALGITIIGILRGAGDTVWPGVVAVVLSWTCLVGLGHWMLAVFPQMQSVGPWVASAVYIILLGIFLLYRFVRGRWREIRLVDAKIAA